MSEARGIEYVADDGTVIVTMGPWLSQNGEREATEQEAQVFYDEGSVSDHPAAHRIRGWRYEGEVGKRALKLDSELKPPTVSHICNRVILQFTAETNGIVDSETRREAADQLASDFARIALSIKNNNRLSGSEV